MARPISVIGSLVALAASCCLSQGQKLRGNRNQTAANASEGERKLSCSPHGDSCWWLDPCCAGLSCQPGVHKCYHSPRKLYEPCILGHECEEGLSCQPGVQKCYPEPRLEGQPCGVGNPCAKSTDRVLQCRSWVHKCEDVPLDDVVPVSAQQGFTSSVPRNQSFALIVLTDVQFYYTECKHALDAAETAARRQERLEECIFDSDAASDDGEKRDRRDRLVQANRDMLRKAQEVMASSSGKYKGIILNGDMVNYGEREVLDQYKSVYGDQDLGVPLFSGMGNHDVEGRTERHAMEMMLYFVQYMKSMNKQSLVRSLDGRQTDTFFEVAHMCNERHHGGSWAYAFDMGQYTFLQLNNPAITSGDNRGDAFTRDVDVWNFAHARQDYFNFTSAGPWLVQELDLAKNRGQFVVIMTHSFLNFERLILSPTYTHVKDAIVRSSAFAIISGHLHARYGLRASLDLWNDPSTRRAIPVLYAGSPFYQKFLDLQFRADGSGLDFRVVDAKAGRPTVCQVGVAYGCDSAGQVEGFVETRSTS